MIRKRWLGVPPPPALACSVSDEILSCERIPPQGLDPQGDFYYRVVTKAIHKLTGRSAVGIAVAARSEKKDWAHLEHDVCCLAATRSKNRSIADLIGGGEVSAEEMWSEVSGEAGNITPPREAPEKTNGKTSVSGSGIRYLNDDRTLDVLRSKEPLKENPENIRQFPLVSGTKNLGILNIRQDGQAGIVPAKPFSVEDHALVSFLIPRILEPMKQKHGLEYAILEVEKQVTWIYINRLTDDKTIKDLVSAASWTFNRALERIQQ